MITYIFDEKGRRSFRRLSDKARGGGRRSVTRGKPA